VASTDTVTGSETVLAVHELVKHFPLRKGIVIKRQYGAVQAVDGVDLQVAAAETVGVVGESGCGKSTLARLLVGLEKPDSGSISLTGREMVGAGGGQMKALRRDVQMIFQDPYTSLNPRMTVGDIIAEPLEIHSDVVPKEKRVDRVRELMALVGLAPEHINRYPHQFSGGQRQRIGIARGLALEPKLLICDEPVSALDVSVQAQVINLLEDLQNEFGLAYVFIAHDLSVVRHISDRVAVMYLGKIMEIADRDDLYAEPMHPYTRSLMSAVPVPDPRLERRRERILLQGDLPSPSNPPSGCVFHTRCPVYRELLDDTQRERCRTQVPVLEEKAPGHQVYCHFSGPDSIASTLGTAVSAV
jgi:oligopeptide/dipeptide ABC transporter ATP-binding protein